MTQTMSRFIECLQIAVISIILLSLSSITVKSQTINFRQTEIVRMVLDGNGQITRELHSEFWSYVTEDLKKNDVQLGDFKKYIDGMLLTASYWQYEVWKSARKSAEEGRIIKTSQYEEYKVEVLEWVSTPEAIDQMQEAIANAEMLIQSAAFKTLMHTRRGSFYVDIALIDQTLGSLESSLQRANNLLDPNWGG